MPPSPPAPSTRRELHCYNRRQEYDDARGRAIAEHLRRAFNEPDQGVADTTPLGRAHNLSASNPLRDLHEFD